MTLPLLLRRAAFSDIKAICEIERLSFPSPWSKWCFLTEYVNPHSTILVAGPPPPQPWQVWGYIVFWIVADEMHILNLAVHPDRRRRGIARALLSAALAQGQRQQVAVVSLEVRPSNRAALSLYHSFGFRQVGRRPRYYADNQEDALVYVLFLQQKRDYLGG